MPTRDMDSTPPPMARSFARHDLGGGEIHRLEARGAKAVDLDARHFLAVVGGNRGRAGDVAARLAHGIDTAKNDILDEDRVEIVPLPDGDEALAGQFERGDLMQRSVALAAPARGADVIVDKCLGHGLVLLLAFRPGLSVFLSI
jgi:hypothetical protein